ncbi:DUF6344 domain-containing protein [Streptomyces griseoruber]|uniref:Secreted protein n=1 Tax=Streptomyces griseoruber TaxID=1943 RepID=A0A117RBK9_9ACTN|nr:hypothetical protein AQJ64_21795 [Streptomyces griseoruber]
MTVNRVMKVWTAIVTAFLALCTALGFVASTAGTATAQTGPTHTDAEKADGSESPRAESAGGSSPGASSPGGPGAGGSSPGGESVRGTSNAAATSIAATSPEASSPRGASIGREAPAGERGHDEFPSEERVGGRGVGSVRAAGEAPVGERPNAPVTGSAPATTPSTASAWDWFQTRSLPPTMKQRILAEAHGKSPSCRHRSLTDPDAAENDTDCDPAEAAEPSIPVQR